MTVLAAATVTEGGTVVLYFGLRQMQEGSLA